jgi:HAD superfamily hydrolase (TIGR01484 family)
MIIYLEDKASSIDPVYNKLKNHKMFSEVSKLEGNRIKLITSELIFADDKKRMEKAIVVLNTLSSIKDDLQFTFYPITKEEDKTKKKSTKTKKILGKTKNKLFHIFFDIDSTLTHNGMKTIDWRIRNVFDKFHEQNCTLYFCTGRNYQQVIDLTDGYQLGHPYGIAENGGVIVGIGGTAKPYEYGKINEPRKLIHYMDNSEIRYKLDKEQKNRKTEYCIALDSIDEGDLKNAIRDSNAKVEYHKSKRAYHIMQENVNKGTSIIHLVSDELKLDSDTDEVIGMGDSGLDIKMFEYCDRGYLVSNASSELKRDIPKNPQLREKVQLLKNSAPWAAGELYDRLFKFG